MTPIEKLRAAQKAEAQKRKQFPIAEGVLKYFPNAIKYVAHVSYTGNEQHHPGEPLHWDKSKSTDQADALLRHLIDHLSGEEVDSDGIYHLGKTAWRALALLEEFLENK